MYPYFIHSILIYLLMHRSHEWRFVSHCRITMFIRIHLHFVCHLQITLHITYHMAAEIIMSYPRCITLHYTMDNTIRMIKDSRRARKRKRRDEYQNKLLKILIILLLLNEHIKNNFTNIATCVSMDWIPKQHNQLTVMISFIYYTARG